ncbi:hypothetical protein M8J75_006420 [Diaphorina citri]|nr:hypothetical protein M8J75_006420 [Diaphorina citri]
MSERPGSFWPMAERESYARAPSGEPVRTRNTPAPPKLCPGSFRRTGQNQEHTSGSFRSYARAPSGEPVRTRNTPSVPETSRPLIRQTVLSGLPDRWKPANQERYGCLNDPDPSGLWQSGRAMPGLLLANQSEPGTHLPLRSYARAPSGEPVRTRNTPPVPFEAMPGLLLANQSEPGTHLQFQKPVDP